MHPGNNEYTVALAETEEQLLSFSKQVRPLPGMSNDAARKRLARLIVEIVTNEGLFIGRDHSASPAYILSAGFAIIPLFFNLKLLLARIV